MRSSKPQIISNSKDIFSKHQCIVVIPTYNNANTIIDVIEKTKLYTADILVINDGCTDETAQLLSAINDIQIYTHEVNKGKGIAIQNAIKWAAKNNYKHIITIDSDGQHFPEDLVAFAEALETTKTETVFLGARNLNEEENINGKSSFANKFSNFWFWVETGYRMPDTQTGFRLYPVEPLKNLKWYSGKYEFEIEVLVRSAWKGIDIKSLDIQVYYPPEEERISHFRPLQDFTRISILNTILVILAFAYFRPKMIYRNIKQKTWKEIWRDEIIDTKEANHIKALSIGFGVFMGIIPLWGFQLLIAIPLAILFKLNKAITIFASHISIPPMIPFLIFVSYAFGGLILGQDYFLKPSDFAFDIETIKALGIQYYIGGTALAVVAGLFFGIVSYFLLNIFNKQATEKA